VKITIKLNKSHIDQAGFSYYILYDFIYI